MTDLPARVDAELTSFLRNRRDAVARLDPSSTALVEEMERLLNAGGKRIRPSFCYWGFRAGGGHDRGSPDEPIVRAAAALELLHTMALVHDDLIDDAAERRGHPTTSVWFATRAEELGAPGDAVAFGRSMALLVGDLAAVLAERLLRESGFPPDVVVRAQAELDDVREAMAVGQCPPVGWADDEEATRRAASLKGGIYTVEGPLRIGAILAEAPADVLGCLTAYGRPLGQAFQLRDDLEDGDAAGGVDAAAVDDLVARAIGALDRSLLPLDAADALEVMAKRIAA